MATFKSAAEFYSVFGTFLTEVVRDPQLGPKFTGLGKMILLQFSDPDASILLDCTTDPPQVTIDPATGVESDVAMSMKADDGHKFWLGKYNIALGLAKRSVKVSGNIGAMLGLAPALQPAFASYEAFLRKTDREALLA